MRKVFYCLFFLLLCNSIYAQELNCDVTVNGSKAANTDPKVFKTLETAIKEFMNNRKWTSDEYEASERIDCQILITITDEYSVGKYGADFNIISRRPVFNTDYNSPLLNYIDKDFDFSYAEYDPLDFNENAFLSNLTSMLAFYAYVVIGYDYDSFSAKGGDKYFQKAQTIVNQASNREEPGWKSYEGTRNRYWLVTQLMDPKYAAFRDAFYQYHRMALDLLYEDQVKPLTTVSKTLQTFDAINRTQPNSMIMQLFFNAKSDELVGLYSKAAPIEKSKGVNLLVKLDPVNSEKYQEIMKSGK